MIRRCPSDSIYIHGRLRIAVDPGGAFSLTVAGFILAKMILMPLMGLMFMAFGPNIPGVKQEMNAVFGLLAIGLLALAASLHPLIAWRLWNLVGES